jgi:hypothetical protein
VTEPTDIALNPRPRNAGFGEAYETVFLDMPEPGTWALLLMGGLAAVGSGDFFQFPH